jgi:hypothetical protein
MITTIVDRSNLVWAFAAVCGLAAIQSCASAEVIVAQPGTAFSLPLGQTAALRGNATRLKFNQVREDSRCPANAMCVWAGDAKIELGISRDGGAVETKVMSITPPNNELVTGNLHIRFVGLAPYPGTFPENEPRANVAQFVVNEI